MVRRGSRASAWSVAVLACLVNAACYSHRIPPQPVPEQIGEVPFSVMWEERAGSGFSGTMVVSDSTLYAGALDRRVYAIDLTTGEKVWSKKLPGAVVGGVVLAGDTLYAGTDRPNGRIRALNMLDGKTIWEQRTPKISVPLLLVDGKIIAQSNDGVVLAYSTSNGQFEWRQPVGVALAAPIALEDGNLLVTTLDSLFRLSIDDGRVLQRKPSPGSITANWAATGQFLIAGTTAGTVLKLDPKDLTVLWQVPVESEVLVSPVVSGDTTFVITRPGNLYRLDPGPTPTPVLLAELKLPVVAPLSRLGRWLLIGGADGVLRALEQDGTLAWQLAIWPPIAVPPIVMSDGFIGLGGVGDIHRMVQ